MIWFPGNTISSIRLFQLFGCTSTEIIVTHPHESSRICQDLNVQPILSHLLKECLQLFDYTLTHLAGYLSTAPIRRMKTSAYIFSSLANRCKKDIIDTFMRSSRASSIRHN